MYKNDLFSGNIVTRRNETRIHIFRTKLASYPVVVISAGNWDKELLKIVISYSF